MKKLLLLNNILLILSIGKCATDKAAKNTESQPVQDTLTAITKYAVTDTLGDTIGYTYQPVDTLHKEMTKEDKYKTRPNNPTEAPKHNAPDQAKVDSLKKAKAKEKAK